MGRKGRSAGRQLSKAYSRGAAAAFASANRSSQPRTVALGDAINALTAGPGRTNGLVIDDETRWMLRDPRDDVPFGPINPLRPDAIDPVRPDTGRPEPRLTEYPVAWNLPGSADAPVPWATLRAAAESVDIIRRCISVRQEQLQGLDWSITLDDQIVQGMYAAGTGDTGREDIEAELRRKLLPEIDRLTAFWKNPWKANGVSFEQWVNGIMEDHLVLDAVAIYPRTTYGGDLSAFELIDATTIKLLLDYRGARPEPPFPAFQQILYGFPRAEFGSCYAPDGDDAVKPVEGMLSDQLFYFREQYRSFTPYGYSAVQQALISARLYLRRQGWMLAEYDDGSTPLTFLVPDGTDGTLVEKLTPKTRRQWEDSINAELAGQTRARNRMKVLMPGMTPHQMQGVDERYKPDYDMHLIKMLAGHFGVTSSGLGFSEAKGLGNSGLHEGQADVQQAATTKPDKRMIERIVNELMCTYQGAPAELKFKFTDPDTEDQAAQDASADAQRARGTITLNDDRKRIGKSPFTFPEADMPLALLGTGWVPIEGMAARAEQQAEAEQALVEDQLATSEQGRELAASEAEELSGETAEKALELAAYRRWARKRGGDARRPFICKALAPSDFPGEQVPRDVDFAEWEWVPDGLADDCETADIEKAFGQGNDNWRTLARDSRGRWVKRGSMRVDALGPSTPDKPVLAGLARDAERRRAAAAPKSAASSSGTVDVTRGSSAADKLRRAETMYGSDRSKWPAKARQDAAKLERQLPVSDSSSTMGGMTTPEANPAADRAAAVRAAKSGKAAREVLTGLDQNEVYAVARELGVDTQRTGPGSIVNAVASKYGTKAPAAKPDVAPLSASELAARRVDREQRAAALGEGMAATMAGGAPVAGSMAERIIARQNQAVRDVVTSLQDAPGGWVAMADVRRKLEREHGMDRGQQDAALRRLATTGDRALNTAPEDNQKTLTEADHAAAVDFGAGPQHVISLDPPRVADDRVNIGDPASVQRWMDETGDYLAAAQAAREANPHVDATGRRWIEGADGLWRDGNGAAVPRALLPAKDAPAEPSAAPFGSYPTQNSAMVASDRAGNAVEVRAQGKTARGTIVGEVGGVGRGASGFYVVQHADGTYQTYDKRITHDVDPPRRSVLDTVRESSERADSSVPGLREGVARQQPISHRGGTITPMPPSYEDPNGYVHVVAADGTVLGRRADVATAKLALDNHAKGKPQAGARRMQQSQADRMGITAATRADDGPVTVREEGRQTSPAARAEAVAASTPDAPSAAPALSKKQRDMAARFDRLAGEHAADPDVAQWRARAIELAGEAERINRSDEDAPNAWAVQNQMETVQHEFTHAMAGARAATEARTAGADQRGQDIARTRATLDSRARRVTDRITALEGDIRAMARPRGALSDPHAEARKKARKQLADAKAERQRYLDRIESAERDTDTKLTYDADGKLTGISYEPPTAPTPAAAPSVNDMMAQQMAASVANPSSFGGARGKVTGDQIQQGTRVQFRGTAWEVLEKPRRARPDSEGRTGVVFRARREDQGIEGTMRVNDGSSLELAAPKGGGASRPKADATPAAVDARRKPEAIGTRPAAAAGGTLAQRQQVLSAAVTGGVVGERKLGGGQAADTKLVTLADGTKAVHKITTEAQNDHSPRDQVDAEELAGEVAAALGVRTPAMVRTGPTAAYQEFMPGQPGKALYGRDIPDSVLASDDGVRLGLLDHITANSDRHGGNWLVDGDGSLTGIDNGMAFDYRATMGTHNPFGKRHFEDDANPLSPADVARVRERLAALKPRFTAMKRGAWHKAMMARLDEVARGATGTRDFIL